jgi:hypothetical protein
MTSMKPRRLYPEFEDWVCSCAPLPVCVCLAKSCLPPLTVSRPARPSIPPASLSASLVNLTAAWKSRARFANRLAPHGNQELATGLLQLRAPSAYGSLAIPKEFSPRTIVQATARSRCWSPAIQFSIRGDALIRSPIAFVSRRHPAGNPSKAPRSRTGSRAAAPS